MPDEIQQALMFLDGPDDRKWKQEQRAKRRPKEPMPRVPETGPCCQRCRHWDAPEKGNDFGVCHHLVITLERQRGGFEKGTVLSAAEAVRSFDLVYELLPCKPWFGCSGFRDKAEQENAA